MGDLIQTYKECRANQTCYIVGENALRSLKQAKQVILARELGLEVKFEHEQNFWLDYIGDLDTAKTWSRRFEAGTHEVLQAYVSVDGECVASLGGIVVSCDADGRKYLHAIELELLDEAISTLLTKAVQGE